MIMAKPMAVRTCGRVEGPLHQLQQLGCAAADQGPAHAGKQLEEGPHRIRVLWELRSARLLTAGQGAPVRAPTTTNTPHHDDEHG
jgi:hypothetical protein